MFPKGACTCTIQQVADEFTKRAKLSNVEVTTWVDQPWFGEPIPRLAHIYRGNVLIECLLFNEDRVTPHPGIAIFNKENYDDPLWEGNDIDKAWSEFMKLVFA